MMTRNFPLNLNKNGSNGLKRFILELGSFNIPFLR